MIEVQSIDIAVLVLLLAYIGMGLESTNNTIKFVLQDVYTKSKMV